MSDNGIKEIPLGNTGANLWFAGGGRGNLTFGTRESRKPLPGTGRTKEERQNDNNWKTIFQAAAGLNFKW